VQGGEDRVLEGDEFDQSTLYVCKYHTEIPYTICANKNRKKRFHYHEKNI
jgi:hypothetical protein